MPGAMLTLLSGRRFFQWELHRRWAAGEVRIGPGSCVPHGAVITADGGPVEIGANSVIMEHAVLRATPRHQLTIGGHVLAGPHCYLTG